MEKLEASLMAKKETLLHYFKHMSPTMKELNQKVSQINVSQSAVGIVLLLMSYLGESESVLFHGYEVSNFTHKVLCLFNFFVLQSVQRKLGR